MKPHPDQIPLPKTPHSAPQTPTFFDDERKAPEPSLVNEATTNQHSNEVEERKVFMQDLNKFMMDSNKPLSKLPIMGYKELDLFQLFREVVSHGGFNEVVKNVGTWSKIWKRLGNFDPSITDSSFRLKKNYERYLLEYEYKRFPQNRTKGPESEKLPMHKRTSSGEFESSPTPEKKQKVENKVRKARRKSFREVTPIPKMPIVLGDLVIESLGTIIPRPPYISDKHIWPIGFISTRFFSSMKNPEQKVKYICSIADSGDRPQFVVTAEDDLGNPVVGNSPSGVWKTVLKRVAAKSSSPSHKNMTVSGSYQFGLSHSTVSALIRSLPEAQFIPSPLPSRKRKTSSSDESSNDDERDDPMSPKSPKVDSASYGEYFSARDVQFSSREEMDDLESAVATLYSLRFLSAVC